MSVTFLMCSERSGSNFITKLLNGHPKICGPSTKHIINPVVRNLFRYGDLNSEKNWYELLNDIYKLLSVDFSVWKKTFELEELKYLAPIGDIKSLIINIFMEEARLNGKEHIFIKENQVYEFLPFLMIHYPESKYIYQTRDPRDMSLSWKLNPGHPGGVIRAARQWKLDQQQSLKNYDLLSQINKAHFVTYEKLTIDPEVEIKKILTFLGLSFDRSVFDFHKDLLTKENASKQNAWNNLSKGIIRNNSQKYLKNLTEYEIKLVEKICFYEMKHLGYNPEYSFKELESITDDQIEAFHHEELKVLEHNRSNGVIENMKAKSSFYLR